MTDGKKRAASRQRTFATVVYPESAPEGWIDILKDVHVAAFISPLHDKDTNPDGERKKPHYHVMLMYDSPKNFDSQVKPVFDAIGGVGVENVGSTRGYARYLCHMDNPEKHQYAPEAVQALSGADYRAAIHLPTDDVAMVREICAYIRANKIYSLAELIDIAAASSEDWYSWIMTVGMYRLDTYIKSLAWERGAGYTRAADRVYVDRETGEILPPESSGDCTCTNGEVVRVRMTESDKAEAVRRHDEGETNVSIAAAFGVSEGYIRKLVRKAAGGQDAELPGQLSFDDIEA